MTRHKWKFTERSYNTKYYICERCKSCGSIENNIIFVEKSDNWNEDCDEILNLATVKLVMES